MKVTILCFAQLKDVVGQPRIELELPSDSTVKDLRESLRMEFPAIASEEGRLLVAVNGEYASDETPIPPGAELACFPPVSGG